MMGAACGGCPFFYVNVISKTVFQSQEQFSAQQSKGSFVLRQHRLQRQINIPCLIDLQRQRRQEHKGGLFGREYATGGEGITRSKALDIGGV